MEKQCPFCKNPMTQVPWRKEEGYYSRFNDKIPIIVPMDPKDYIAVDQFHCQNCGFIAIFYNAENPHFPEKP